MTPGKEHTICSGATASFRGLSRHPINAVPSRRTRWNRRAKKNDRSSGTRLQHGEEPLRRFDTYGGRKSGLQVSTAGTPACVEERDLPVRICLSACTRAPNVRDENRQRGVPYLNDRVKERENVHERAERRVGAFLQQVFRRLCVRALHVRPQTIRRLRHDFQRALQEGTASTSHSESEGQLRPPAIGMSICMHVLAS